MSTITETPAVAGRSDKPPKLKKGGLNAGEGRRGLMLVAPTLLLLAVVIVYPLVKAVIMSFQKDAGLDPASGLFVEGGPAGLSNYSHWLLQRCATADGGTVSCPPGNSGSQFYSALGVTLFFTVFAVLLETLLGLWFATIMNRDFKGRGLVRAAILVPWAIPTAVTAKLWYFIFAFDGIANRLLGGLGISPQLWTSDPTAAKFAVIIADTWKTAPFMALLILAGLQLVGADVYEAAAIDGASKWQVFTRITLPIIKVPLMVAVLFRTLDTLRIFDLPYILTGGSGGTTTLSMLVVSQIRAGFNSASALSTIIKVIIALAAFLFITFGADVVPKPPRAPARKKGPRRGGAQPTDATDATDATAGTVASSLTTPGA